MVGFLVLYTEFLKPVTYKLANYGSVSKWIYLFKKEERQRVEREKEGEIINHAISRFPYQVATIAQLPGRGQAKA